VGFHGLGAGVICLGYACCQPVHRPTLFHWFVCCLGFWWALFVVKMFCIGSRLEWAIRGIIVGCHLFVTLWVHSRCGCRVRFIYRSAKGYLPWIWYVAHQTNCQYPLRCYSTQWVGYNKVYPYWKKCTTSGRSVLLPENLFLYRENFHSLLEEYSFYKYLLCHTE